MTAHDRSDLARLVMAAERAHDKAALQRLSARMIPSQWARMLRAVRAEIRRQDGVR